MIHDRSCEAQRERVSADAGIDNHHNGHKATRRKVKVPLCTFVSFVVNVYFPNREGSAGILPANGEDPSTGAQGRLPESRRDGGAT